MASTPSQPALGAEERFDKAKKHLWASESPKFESNKLNRPAEHREPSMESRSPDYIDSQPGQPETTDRPRSPQWKARPEATECILKAPSTRTQHVLPPLSREGFNFDHDRRLPPPRSWSTTEHSHLRGRPIASRTASSLTEPRTNNESRQQRPSYPVSLSVFNSPTATYMWPGFQAASQMSHPPVIYVNYDNRDSTRSASTSSVSSLHDSPVISSPALTHYDRPTTNMLPQKRRSSSPDGRISPVRNSSFRSLMEPMSQVHLSDKDDRPQSAQRPQRQDGPSISRPDRPFSIPLTRNPSINNSVTSSDDDQLRTSREDSPHVSEASEPSRLTQPTIRRPSPRGDAETWERHAKPTLSADGTTRRWQCTWTTSESGRRIDCKYTSKKQLVKRHVETTHLRFKPFICEVCKKGFPQKTSLDTHMHGHTGSTPHVCRYGCGMAFKDPARRHRHMVEEHGYVPRQSKKKHKIGQSPQETSDFEPVRPFTFIGGAEQ
ncbi:hypothetical protein HYDPIDRAFT_105312 [Hydnomerulius pinastri MD-312]|nr:hypothetical protein HYDPIDRAFT_105312 [Hydnomerulius pinastri MD-312]